MPNYYDLNGWKLVGNVWEGIVKGNGFVWYLIKLKLSRACLIVTLKDEKFDGYFLVYYYLCDYTII